MTLVNNLHTILSKPSLHHEIQLPEIVVVGDQSSGKSSLLQSIILRDILPKGIGIVTKCPIRICIRSTNLPNEFAIFPDISPNQVPLTEIRDKIKEINDKQSEKFGISDIDIKVDFYTPKMASLTLVDLPGIIQNVDDGVSSNLRDKIEALVTSRISQENTIILAICNSAIDLNNSVSLRKAREADPELQRTMLVFTKMDICQDADSVINPKIKTGLGHVGVICRSQNDIKNNIDIERQVKNEETYFNTKEPYLNHQNMFGVSVLRKNLEIEFKRHVLGKLPEIQNKILEVQERVQNELELIGTDYSNITDKLVFAQESLNTFFVRAGEIMDGKHLILDQGRYKGGFSIREILESIKNVFEILKKNQDDEFDEGNYEYQRLYDQSMGLEGISTVSIPIVKEIMKKKIKRAEKDIFNLVKKVKKEIYNLLELAFKELFSTLGNFKCIVFDKIDETLEECEKNTNERIVFMLTLEYETLECEKEMIDPDNPLGSLINQLFERSKSNIIRNFVKYVKLYLIHDSIDTSKNKIMDLIFREYSKRPTELFPEIEKSNNKRKKLVEDLKSLKFSYQEIKKFFQNNNISG